MRQIYVPDKTNSSDIPTAHVNGPQAARGGQQDKPSEVEQLQVLPAPGADGPVTTGSVEPLDSDPAVEPHLAAPGAPALNSLAGADGGSSEVEATRAREVAPTPEGGGEGGGEGDGEGGDEAKVEPTNGDGEAQPQLIERRGGDTPAKLAPKGQPAPITPTEIIDAGILRALSLEEIKQASPVDLLAYIAQVVTVLRGYWLLLVPVLERVRKDRLWRQLHNEDGSQKYAKWEEYAETELAAVGALATIRQQFTAWNYVREHEPKALDAPGGRCDDHNGGSNRLEYRVIAELNALRNKAEAKLIDPLDYQKLHDGYFGGEIPGPEVLKRSKALKKAAKKAKEEKARKAKEELAAHLEAGRKAIEEVRALEGLVPKPDQAEALEPEPDVLPEVPESEDETEETEETEEQRLMKPEGQQLEGPEEQRLVEPSPRVGEVSEVPEPAPPGDQPGVPMPATASWSRDALLLRGLEVLEREARTPDSPLGPALGNLLKPLAMLRAVVEVLSVPVEGSDPLERAFEDYKERLAGTHEKALDYHREYVAALLELLRAAVSPAEVVS